jgi:hypothetical protein
MSKNSNVNPGQYKVGGRLRPNEDTRTEEAKAQEAIAEHDLREEAKREKDNTRASDD